jgi:hypothetical protein
MPVTHLTPDPGPMSLGPLSLQASSQSTTTPFISPKDIVDYIGRGGTADPGIIIAADAACDMCRTVAGQLFNEITGDTITLDGTGTDTVLLPNVPVNAVGTITLNGGTITDWMFNDNGVVFRGTAGVDPRPVWPRGRQNVTITYDHGYAEVDIPRDVRMVALALATRLVLQGAAIEEQRGTGRIRYAGPATDLTMGEQLILGKYRHIR